MEKGEKDCNPSYLYLPIDFNEVLQAYSQFDNKGLS